MSRDTIFALSSGRPPAGVAVVRISGHKALETLNNITDNVPIERRATLACLRALDGTVLDHALVLAFPAPNSFTGEDVAELHLHGGSAVVAAVLDDLAKRSGHRLAESGEFSRRAFDNGKFDLTQAEGLADLIAAESEAQRRQALAQGGGRLRERAENWRCRILALQAAAEADLDFSDEGDVVAAAPGADLPALIGELADSLDDGHLGERLREGFAIAVIGEPNVGKSSLINALSGRDAAIVTDIPGTTRDIIEVPLTLAGLPILLVDTAGLRDSDDPIEAEGIRRARARARDADLVLQVYDAAASPPQPIAGAMQIANKLDTVPAIGQASRPTGLISVSARDGTNIGPLKQTLSEWAGTMGAKAEAALITQRRHRDAIADAVDALRAAVSLSDPVLHAEHLRLAARAIGRLTGRAGVEDMLDALFGAFCIGK